MADLRIQFNEEMVGTGHPVKADTLNRLSLVEHNNDGTHKYKREMDIREFLPYDFVTDGSADYTTELQAAINHASKNTHRIVAPQGKFTAGRLRFYYDAVNNPGYAQNGPGRITIEGASAEAYTGTQKALGTQFIHKDGEATPFLDCLGDWSSNSGRFLNVRDMLIVGGDDTTAVVRMEDMTTNSTLENLWVRVMNPAGDGILYYRSWSGIFRNIRVHGGASGTGAWTGRGFAAYSENTSQTVNMTLLQNIDVYSMGRGFQIGHVSETPGGIIGPIVMLGGQASNSDQEGMVFGTGATCVNLIGVHTELSRKNGMKFTKAVGGGNPILITAQGCTFYDNGSGGTGDEQFNVLIDRAEGVKIDMAKFFECHKGIKITVDANVQSTEIGTLSFTPSAAGEGATGVGIEVESEATFSQRITLNDDVRWGNGFNGGASNLVDANNNIRKKLYRSRAHIFSGGETAPAINAWDRAIRFANSGATSVTNFTGGDVYQELIVTFANLNTTLKDAFAGGSFQLAGGADFTPASTYDTISLMKDPGGTNWIETSRSIN